MTPNPKHPAEKPGLPTRRRASEVASQLGCTGAHQKPDGTWAPCESPIHLMTLLRRGIMGYRELDQKDLGTGLLRRLAGGIGRRRPHKRPAVYDPRSVDADGDNLAQEGTTAEHAAVNAPRPPQPDRFGTRWDPSRDEAARERLRQQLFPDRDTPTTPLRPEGAKPVRRKRTGPGRQTRDPKQPRKRRDDSGTGEPDAGPSPDGRGPSDGETRSRGAHPSGGGPGKEPPNTPPAGKDDPDDINRKRLDLFRTDREELRAALGLPAHILDPGTNTEELKDALREKFGPETAFTNLSHLILNADEATIEAIHSTLQDFRDERDGGSWDPIGPSIIEKRDYILDALDDEDLQSHLTGGDDDTSIEEWKDYFLNVASGEEIAEIYQGIKLSEMENDLLSLSDAEIEADAEMAAARLRLLDVYDNDVQFVNGRKTPEDPTHISRERWVNSVAQLPEADISELDRALDHWNNYTRLPPAEQREELLGLLETDPDFINPPEGDYEPLTAEEWGDLIAALPAVKIDELSRLLQERNDKTPSDSISGRSIDHLREDLVYSGAHQWEGTNPSRLDQELWEHEVALMSDRQVERSLSKFEDHLATMGAEWIRQIQDPSQTSDAPNATSLRPEGAKPVRRRRTGPGRQVPRGPKGPDRRRGDGGTEKPGPNTDGPDGDTPKKPELPQVDYLGSINDFDLDESHRTKIAKVLADWDRKPAEGQRRTHLVHWEYDGKKLNTTSVPILPSETPGWGDASRELYRNDSQGRSLTDPDGAGLIVELDAGAFTSEDPEVSIRELQHLGTTIMDALEDDNTEWVIFKIGDETVQFHRGPILLDGNALSVGQKEQLKEELTGFNSTNVPWVSLISRHSGPYSSHFVPSTPNVLYVDDNNERIIYVPSWLSKNPLLQKDLRTDGYLPMDPTRTRTSDALTKRIDQGEDLWDVLDGENNNFLALALSERYELQPFGFSYNQTDWVIDTQTGETVGIMKYPREDDNIPSSHISELIGQDIKRVLGLPGYRVIALGPSEDNKEGGGTRRHLLIEHLDRRGYKTNPQDAISVENEFSGLKKQEIEDFIGIFLLDQAIGNTDRSTSNAKWVKGADRPDGGLAPIDEGWAFIRERSRPTTRADIEQSLLNFGWVVKWGIANDIITPEEVREYLDRQLAALKQYLFETWLTHGINDKENKIEEEFRAKLRTQIEDLTSIDSETFYDLIDSDGRWSGSLRRSRL